MSEPKEENSCLKVCVIGISGSGKTTFATRLAEETQISHHELDLMNWRSNWYDRSKLDTEAFKQDVIAAVAGDNWVIAGGYRLVRPIIFSNAKTVVWIDLPFYLTLYQVFKRSLKRAVDKAPILNGNRENFARWFSKGHPLYFVLFKFKKKRRDFERLLAQPEWEHLEVIRCKNRRQVELTLRELSKRKFL